MKTYQEFKKEKIINLLKEYGVTDFENNNIRYICKYGKIENIKALKGEDFTNDNISHICEYGEVNLIKEYLKLNKD